MQPVIELRRVTKTYGTSRGVEALDLQIMPGAIFGFLGPNGAGKTTTISMLVDLIRPTSGTISIFGLNAQKQGVDIRKRIGFLAGDFALDENLTGWQQLNYFANLHGDVETRHIRELAQRLSCDLDRHIKTLSRGNRQKIGLISALMHEPELLIFDEPTSGLDPLIQAEFNKILLERKAKGKTAFISSHMLSEVQETCDHVAFIREGQLIAVQHMQDLAVDAPKRLKIISADKALKKALVELKGLRFLASTGNELDCSYEGEISILLKLLAKHPPEDLTIQEADLETIFMKYYEGQK